jgi:hypothetical protein
MKNLNQISLQLNLEEYMDMLIRSAERSQNKKILIKDFKIFKTSKDNFIIHLGYNDKNSIYVQLIDLNEEIKEIYSESSTDEFNDLYGKYFLFNQID